MAQQGEEAGPRMNAEAPCPQTLLDLGASPDYKDSRGLTPLYHSALGGGDALCCELLLHDHAQLGTTDENGWQEIHQVGRECEGGECLLLSGGKGEVPGSVREWGAGFPALSVGLRVLSVALFGDPTAPPSSPRPAALGTCSTWNTCCSMELTWGLRTPQETQRCTSVPSITRCDYMCIRACAYTGAPVQCLRVDACWVLCATS